MPVKPKHIAIWGASYSGSTLLNFLLGSQAKCIGLGEVNHLASRQWTAARSGRLCSVCPPSECPLLHSEIPRRKDYNLANIYLDLIDCAARVFQCYAVVSSSKVPAFYPHNPDYVIWLKAHPCKLALSCRRYHDYTMAQAAGAWIDVHSNISRAIINRNLQRQTIAVEYAQLCHDPLKTITDLREFCGITYEPPRVEFWNHANQLHTIGGNAGTYGHLPTVDWVQTSHAPAVDRARQRGQIIAIDNRWQTELRPDDIAEVCSRVEGDVDFLHDQIARVEGPPA